MVRQMSDEHKAANAKARSENRAVSDYLEALETNRPKRGRKRTADAMQKRLEAIAEDLETASPIRRVQLVQERIDLEQAIVASDDAVDMSELEDGFVAVAQAYSGRKGITYSAWREVGVPASVLQRSGISRSRA